MKKEFLWLTALLFILLTRAETLSAQSCISYMPNFSVYNSESTDGTNIFGSTTIDGSGYMNLNTQYAWCESAFIPPGTVHYPQVTMQLGKASSWIQGASACPDCYISSDGDIELEDATDGEAYDLNWWTQVDCTQAGQFFASNGFVSVAIAVTTYKIVTVNSNNSVSFARACPANTIATCGSSNILGSQPTIWAEEFQLRVKIGGGGNQCFLPGTVQYWNGPPAPYPCS